ncbi:hypothetical protein GKZ28_19685 [Clostridium chromiireducens]|uniref:Uncharacterized protein n=2 Tax=Clostridium chromiireducens TaxID=225345 RepID=A0A964W475_9CLOT|nr:hypothetical protein [Clostridium chromiireducens]
MTNNEYELKREYSIYTRTDEAAAVYYVRELVESIDTQGKWIDIIFSDRYYSNYDEKPAFKKVIVELFKRKINPKYPKDADMDLKRAITWKAAHEDIEKQRNSGIVGSLFEVTGVYYNKNRGKFENKSFDYWNEEYGGFDYTGKVPTTTIVRRVEMGPKWIYKITGVKKKIIR